MPVLAFPSWVIPGSIADNAAFICSKWQELAPVQDFASCQLLVPIAPQPEIGLCFFEAKACLEYTKTDLPRSLAKLPASWHVHLPLDLPMHKPPNAWSWQTLKQNVQASVDICLALLKKVEFLGVEHVVLHPAANCAPTSQAEKAQEAVFLEFAGLWQNAGKEPKHILWENQPGNNLEALLNLAQQTASGLCLDLAHMFIPAAVNADKKPKSTPKTSLPEAYLKRAKMVHINAPGNTLNGHASLTTLNEDTLLIYKDLFATLSQKELSSKIWMLELFRWKDIESSLPFVQSWLRS